MAGIGVSPTAFVLVVLLAIGAGGADAVIFNPSRPVNVTVTGQVCCTLSGNCPGTPVAGATVALNCSGSLAVSNTTTATGNYSLSATITSNSVTGATTFSRCFFYVQLPVPAAAACPVLSNSGGRLASLVRRTGQVNGVQIGTPFEFFR